MQRFEAWIKPKITSRWVAERSRNSLVSRVVWSSWLACVNRILFREAASMSNLFGTRGSTPLGEVKLAFWRSSLAFRSRRSGVAAHLARIRGPWGLAAWRWFESSSRWLFSMSSRCWSSGLRCRLQFPLGLLRRPRCSGLRLCSPLLRPRCWVLSLCP
jgi:hypothetical protein